MDPLYKRYLLCVLAVLYSLVLGCASQTSLQSRAESNPPFPQQHIPSGQELWVSIQNSTESADSGEELRSTLIAFLQSEAALSIADSEEQANYVLRVNVLQVGLSDSEHVGMSLADGFGSAATGAVLGLGIGSGFGRQGGAWGTGAGLAVGLGVGYALNSDKSQDTWTMIADVQLLHRPKNKKNAALEAVAQSRMASTVQGIGIKAENAIPALESTLSQEIVTYFRKESS